VLLGEPARTPYDLNFSLFGIPVRVHPLFWLVGVIFGAQGNDGIGILTWVAAVFLSILIHELGHAAVMRLFGFRPWIVLYGMGGLACRNPQDTFRSRKFDDSLMQILICAAGPVAGFLLAAALALGFFASGHGAQVDFESPWGLRPWVSLSPQNFRLQVFFNSVSYICVFWGLVNLLPVYPLDGGQIAREVLLRVSPGDGIRQSMLLSIFAAGGMALYGYTQLNSTFVALFFGYLAYMSYVAYQSYSGRGRWQ
jgi:stage IV sporulation protein FB